MVYGIKPQRHRAHGGRTDGDYYLLGIRCDPWPCGKRSMKNMQKTKDWLEMALDDMQDAICPAMAGKTREGTSLPPFRSLARIQDIWMTPEGLPLGESITLIGPEGRPVALLVSLKSKKNESIKQTWDWEARIDTLAQKVSQAWKGEKTAVEVLSEMRR